MSKTVACVFGLALVTAACGGRQGPKGDRIDPDDAVVQITCEVPEADLWIDGHYFARIVEIPRAGFAIAPGSHRLEIRHDDYHAYYTVLELKKKEHRTLDVDLAERLP